MNAETLIRFLSANDWTAPEDDTQQPEKTLRDGRKLLLDWRAIGEGLVALSILDRFGFLLGKIDFAHAPEATLYAVIGTLEGSAL